MNKLQRLIEAGQFKITSGEEYLWKCYGNKARYLEMEANFPEDQDKNSINVKVDIVFDILNQNVYEVCLYVEQYVFHWIEPEFETAYRQECYSKDIDPRIAYDDVFYSECEVFDDLLEKVRQCFENGVCDTSILISLSLNKKNVELFERLAEVQENVSVENFIINAVTEKLQYINDGYKEVWKTIFKSLSKDGISINLSNEFTPVSHDNVLGIENWIKSLGLAEVDLIYYDKETVNGVESFLSVENSSSSVKNNSLSYTYMVFVK